nr:hypothetical protein [Sphingomonas sp. CDS-1]
MHSELEATGGKGGELHLAPSARTIGRLMMAEREDRYCDGLTIMFDRVYLSNMMVFDLTPAPPERSIARGKRRRKNEEDAAR